MNAPFPYFGGKRSVVDDVWRRLGRPRQYIEPFCGSAAMLLGNPHPASLEVVGDANGFIANFWRAVKHDPDAVARGADYPVSHVEGNPRRAWLMAQRERLADGLRDAEWPGDAKAAGWWLWGQCAWIGSGWCEWSRSAEPAIGQIPHAGNAGRGVQAIGKIPHASDADEAMLTSAGRTALVWLRKLAARLERVRIIHGSWDRCLNHHFGGDETALFLDPPYKGFEQPYASSRVADDVEAWAREHAHLRIALCGHVGDYALDGWQALRWKRTRFTYSGDGTRDKECIWFSPACLPVTGQRSLFGGDP
jgi:hypothetical protein